MPQQAYTYTPEYSTDEAGEPQFTGNGQLTAGHRGGVIYDQTYAEDELTGERQFLIDDNDYQADEDYLPNEDYADIVSELYPSLPDALEWASTALDPITAQAFNEAVDSGDESVYMPLLEALMEDYWEAEGFDEDDDSDAYEPEDDVTQEEFDGVISELAESEPLGYEIAMPYLEKAIEFQGTHPCLSEMCQLTARFHTNEISYEDAVDQLVGKYPLSEIKKFYQYLSN